MSGEGSESNALEKVIKSALSLLNSNEELPSHGNWTKFVVEKLAKAAEKHQCETHGHGCGNREFMYDMTWLKTRDDGTVLDAALVMECEWGADHHVLEDFRKLLLGRADLRLMVFEGRTLETDKKLILRMCDEIRGFSKTNTGDRYLFAFWPRDSAAGFQFDLYVVP